MADETQVAVTGSDATKIRKMYGDSKGRQRIFPPPARRRRGTPAAPPAGSGGVLIVAILKSIEDGAEPIKGIVHEKTDEQKFVNVDGVEVTRLPLYAYSRRVLSLPFFRVATEEELGSDWDENKQQSILETEIVDPEEGDPDTRQIIQYVTTDVFYDDAKGFELDEDYNREDYPDYPEDEVFPPDGTGTYAIQPPNYLKKGYPGICNKDETGGWVLETILCRALEPPPLVEAS